MAKEKVISAENFYEMSEKIQIMIKEYSNIKLDIEFVWESVLGFLNDLEIPCEISFHDLLERYQ